MGETPKPPAPPPAGPPAPNPVDACRRDAFYGQMRPLTFASFAVLLVSIWGASLGCELIATVDRTKIPGSGGGIVVGSGGGETTTASGSGGGTTSSTGGTGGTGGGDAGDGGTTCTTVQDCPSPPNECVSRTCTAGVCGTAEVPAGTKTAVQTAGDCKQNQCDGSGNIKPANDDTDLPVDGNDCTDDVCTAGVPSNPPKPSATACGTGGTLFCNGAGQCVGCLTATDCAGQDTDCHTRTCTAGVCGVSNAAQGTMVTAQTPGDCMVNQCDGNGAVVAAQDNADVPVDGETCTKDLCNAGVPSNPPEAVGQACSEGSGTECDGAGHCVACLAATDCPGQDTQCQKRACNSGVCGVTNTAQGTAVTMQTAGDCQKVVCDGNGATTSQADDTDLPNDNNACTNDVCTAGVPSHSDLSDGTSCGGVLTCLSGTCSGCSQPSDCPGTDDDCKTRSCSAGLCGFDYTAIGTAVSAQTAGDCQQGQCDGSGNTVGVEDDTDVPADDGNQCTAEICTAGVPSHPAQPVNTACSQGGGAFCSASSTCVACNAGSQCPGTDTDCETRSCTANTCGFTFQPAGTVTSTQTPGDCKVNQCDGSGNIVAVTANGDVPADDGNQCTGEVCTAGVPSHPAVPVNTACNQGGGSFCSAVAICVQCNTAPQCPGSDTECQTRTCVAGACGLNKTAAGTPTTTQTPGDCHQNQCDGNGNIVNAVDNTDVPADDGNQCTGEVCTAGVPAHPALPVDTACNQGGGSFCNATGTCVQCNAPVECPGSDTECQARTSGGGRLRRERRPRGHAHERADTGRLHAEPVRRQRQHRERRRRRRRARRRRQPVHGRGLLRRRAGPPPGGDRHRVQPGRRLVLQRDGDLRAVQRARRVPGLGHRVPGAHLRRRRLRRERHRCRHAHERADVRRLPPEPVRRQRQHREHPRRHRPARRRRPPVHGRGLHRGRPLAPRPGRGHGVQPDGGQPVRRRGLVHHAGRGQHLAHRRHHPGRRPRHRGDLRRRHEPGHPHRADRGRRLLGLDPGLARRLRELRRVLLRGGHHVGR